MLAARWPDEIAVYRAIAEEAVEIRDKENEALARRITSEVTEAFNRGRKG